MAFRAKKDAGALPKKKGTGGTGFVIGAECIYFLLGAILLFVPQIEIIHICYGLSAVMVSVGILQIVRYFMTESYQNINEYGFSFGVLEVILGMCALVRAQAIVSSFLVVLGIGLLLTAIIKLQYAMDLKSMSDPVWIPFIVLAAALVGGAVCVIVNPFTDPSTLKTVTYYLLMIDGVIGILGNLYLFIRVKLYNKRAAAAPEAEHGTAAGEAVWGGLTETSRENAQENFQEEMRGNPNGSFRTEDAPSENPPLAGDPLDDWLDNIPKAEEE